MSLPLLSSSTSCTSYASSSSLNFAPKSTKPVRNQALQPTTYQRWERDYDFINSLMSDYKGETYGRQIEKMKEEVRCLLRRTDEPIARLNLIDTLERLGVGYHFKKEINEALSIISVDDDNGNVKRDLYATSLRFRLLRQHGFMVSQEVFNEFMNESEFMASLCEDIKGLLNLYEASFLGCEGETILDKARDFSTKHIRSPRGNVDQKMKIQVDHALELPYHWRTQRMETRWYIELYIKDDKMNPLLFELAKLDYNMVQTMYQSEAKALSSWWWNLCLPKHLSFSRSCLLECFVWAIGYTSEPKFGLCREALTRVSQFVTTIDDVYDAYGSLEELELFTDAVDRWDVKAIEKLPPYMQVCFLALFNTTNEMAYNILTEEGWEIIGYLSRSWADLCKAYLAEEKWHRQGYTPTFDEYLNNAWVSVSGPVLLTHTYFLTRPKIRKEELQLVETNRELIRCASMIFRLLDDLETSTVDLNKGGYCNCVPCYMHETGSSEAVAREHVQGLIHDMWKNMNKEILSDSPLPPSFIYSAFGLARWVQYYYQDADGFGIADYDTEARAMPLVANPISVKEY